jgi:hypothetical protein
MSHVFSSNAAQLWAERIAQCERSNLSAPSFCQSIGCWLTSYAPPGPAHLRGGHRLLPICRPDGPENPSSHRESLTKPGAISKPELQ